MKLKNLIENEIPNITDPYKAYQYALLQRNRIPELEPIIMKKSWVAIAYVTNIIKDRWPEAEPYIFTHSTNANDYLRCVPEARTPSKDVPLVIGKYAITDVPNTITDEQLEKLLKLIDPSLYNIRNIHHFRTFFEPTIIEKLKTERLIKTTTSQLLKDTETLNKMLTHFKSFNLKNDFI